MKAKPKTKKKSQKLRMMRIKQLLKTKNRGLKMKAMKTMKGKKM